MPVLHPLSLLFVAIQRRINCKYKAPAGPNLSPTCNKYGHDKAYFTS